MATAETETLLGCTTLASPAFNNSIPVLIIVYHSILQYDSVHHSIPQYDSVHHSILQYNSVHHSILQYTIVYYSIWAHS